MRRAVEAVTTFATRRRKLPVQYPEQGRRRPARQTRTRRPCLESESRVRQTPRVSPPPEGQCSRYLSRPDPKSQIYCRSLPVLLKNDVSLECANLLALWYVPKR